MADVAGYLERCRCCLEDLGNSHSLISSDHLEIFEALTSSKMLISPMLSSNLCLSCVSQFDSIRSFSNKLLHTEKLLSDLIEKSFVTSFVEVKDTDLVASEFDLKNTEATQYNPKPKEFIPRREEPAKGTAIRPKSSNEQKNVDEFPENACPMCGKKFTEKRKIPLHIKRIHVKIKDFLCDEPNCDYAAYTRFDIVRHKRNIHAPPTEEKADKRICPDCGKVVRGNNQLTLHIRKKHLLIKKFQCDLCEFASYGKYEIRSHLQHVHIPKEFKESHPCQSCPSVLSSAMGLKVHIQHKHSGLKPHPCFCGKSFSLRETLKTHVRNVHKGERRFSCSQCSKRFGQAIRLRDHINNAHGQKQEIPCAQCSKVFHSSRNLKAHLVYHEEPKYSCDQCGKKFFLSNKLKEHWKTHDSADHYCSVCSRSFQLFSSLKRHMRTHEQKNIPKTVS